MRKTVAPRRVRLPDSFHLFFAPYALIAGLLLVLGLVPYLASSANVFRDQLQAWTGDSGLLADVANAILEPAHGHVVAGAGALVRDYFFSILSLGCGIFIVSRRPSD